MNGCLDNDFVDEVDVFDDINPTIPPVNCSGSSLYDQEDPILVGYSDPNNYATVSSSISLTTQKPRTDALYSNSSSPPRTKDHNSFRPVEPAQITPSVHPSSEAGKSDHT